MSLLHVTRKKAEGLRKLSVTYDGGSLHADFYGRSGRGVIFGHSLFCDRRMFDHQVRALAGNYRVLNMDLRDHGLSSASPRDYSLSDLARDYVRVLDEAQVEVAVVVGCSLGAMAAMQLAMEFSDRVFALILFDTKASSDKPLVRLKRSMMIAAGRIIGPHPRLLKMITNELFGSTFRKDHPDVVRLWARRIADMPAQNVARALKTLNSRPSLLEDLGRIEHPALVVAGDEDRTTPVFDAQQIVSRLPNGRLNLVARAGHLSPIEKPQKIISIMTTFLRDIGW